MKIEDLPAQVLSDLAFDYRNEWSGLDQFFRANKPDNHPGEINPDSLEWILKAYDVPNLDNCLFAKDRPPVRRKIGHPWPACG
jgi:hypothetical protein